MTSRTVTTVPSGLAPYLNRIRTEDFQTSANATFRSEGNEPLLQRCARRILRLPGFDNAMGTIIVLNLIVMIIETDQSADEEVSSKWIEVFGITALMIFILELSVRLLAFQCDFWKDEWNIFDFLIVFTDMIFTTVGFIAGNAFPVSMLRIFRLAKLARVSKVLRVFPELRLLLAGLTGSLSSIFWGTLLLFFCLLVWSIVAVLFIHPINKDIDYGDCERCPRAYSSVMQAALTFWQQMVTGDSWGQVTIPVMESQPITGMFFIPVFLSIGMAVMNLILGVVVSVAQQAKERLEEEAATEKALYKLGQQTNLIELCKSMDKDKSGELSQEEIYAGFDEPGEFRDSLIALDIKKEDLEIVWGLMDSDRSGSVSYKEFVNQLCTMNCSDNEFMLAYIKYHLDSLKKSFMQHLAQQHEEVVKDIVKLEEEVCDIAERKDSVLEMERQLSMQRTASQSVRASRLLEMCTFGQDKSQTNAESFSQEMVGRQASPVDELFSAAANTQGRQRSSVATLAESVDRSENCYSEYAKPDITFSTAAASINDEDIQTLFKIVRQDIRALRFELGGRLMHVGQEFGLHAGPVSAPELGCMECNVQPRLRRVPDDKASCSFLPTCWKTEAFSSRHDFNSGSRVPLGKDSMSRPRSAIASI